MHRNSGQEYRLARAALRLRNFTVSELESLTGASENTVYSFLHRLTKQNPGYVRSDALEQTGRGRPKNRYWLTEAGIDHLLDWSSEIANLFAEADDHTPAVQIPGIWVGGLKLILADRQAIFRQGIAKVLAVENEIRIVAQAQTAEQMFMALDKFRAAVLIIAGGFHSDFNSVLAAANKNKTRVVVLADTGESAQRYLAAGAHGVVYRNVTSPALVDCVRKIARGENWVQDIAVASELTENDMVGLRVRDRLTAKEMRIMALIVQGYKNKEIATQLGTTEQVVKNYLRNVYDKIGVSDRFELALFTVHHRFLSESEVAKPIAASPSVLAALIKAKTTI